MVIVSLIELDGVNFVVLDSKLINICFRCWVFVLIISEGIGVLNRNKVLVLCLYFIVDKVV